MTMSTRHAAIRRSCSTRSRGCAREVAQLEQRVEQLDQLAHQDPLIDLPNRRGFMRELEAADRPRRAATTTPAAMLFVDLDGLKMINDTLRPPGRRRGADPGRRAAGRRACARATAWRGSAATNSASCSTMPTRRARIETAEPAGRHDRRLRVHATTACACRCQRRDRRRPDRAGRHARARHGPRRRGDVPAKSGRGLERR